MRNTVKVVLFLCAFVIIESAHAAGAHALSTDDFALTDDPFYKQSQVEKQKKLAEAEESKKEAEEKQKAEDAAKAAEAATAQPVTHTVAAGESLSTVAAQYSSTWKRLFDKNTQISNPDVVSVGEVITIPASDEQLTERALPTPAPAAPATQGSQYTARARSTSNAYTAPRGSSAGNTYAPGYCTWYAKSRRPDLPNRLGNAATWVSRAAAQGFATGSTPQVGAIGQQGNHVVYVESVNGDGTVTVSEMNYRGLYVISSRTAPADSFRYIY